MTDTNKQRTARTGDATAICAWQMDEDGVWWTDCGEGFIIDNLDSPRENGFRFCCYCGREMEEGEASQDGGHDAIRRLVHLAGHLPTGLHADWRDSGHYELTSSEDDYWWLQLGDYLPDGGDMWPDTIEGQRIGLLLDIAEALKAAEPELRRIAP